VTERGNLTGAQRRSRRRRRQRQWRRSQQGSCTIREGWAGLGTARADGGKKRLRAAELLTGEAETRWWRRQLEMWWRRGLPVSRTWTKATGSLWGACGGLQLARRGVRQLTIGGGFVGREQRHICSLERNAKGKNGGERLPLIRWSEGSWWHYIEGRRRPNGNSGQVAATTQCGAGGDRVAAWVHAQVGWVTH
jgi:hypothetical protein